MIKPKDLHTYVLNICHINILDIRYKGSKVVPSISAMRELKHGKTLDFAVCVLEEGHDAPRKRARGKIERWLYRGRKIYNAVVTKDYNEKAREKVWVLMA